MTAVAALDAGRAFPPAAVEIVPGRLYAVGGALPASADVSWVRGRQSGWMPVQCYLFRSGGEALVLDCGLPLHASEIGAGLDVLLEGCPPPRLLISRWEPDAMAGLPWLVERYRVREVLSYAGLNPLDFFEGFEAMAARSQVEAGAPLARLVPIVPGEVIAHGDLRIEAISPALRLLLTMWYYEATTRTLFTADAFAMLANAWGPQPFVARPGAAAVSADDARSALLAKFDWLIGAHVEEVVSDLEQLLDRLPVERICPSIGGVIEGAPAVRQGFAATIEAVRTLAAEPRRSCLHGFDWSAALR